MTKDTPSLADELLPCPFCGGEASGEGHVKYRTPLADTTWDDGSEITEAFFVNCVKCGIDNGRSGLVGGYRTRGEAHARWNTRSTEARTGGDALREALEKIKEHCRNGFEPKGGLAARIAWCEKEIREDPLRSLYGDGDEPPFRNGHEFAHLLVEYVGLLADKALSTTPANMRNVMPFAQDDPNRPGASPSPPKPTDDARTPDDA